MRRQNLFSNVIATSFSPKIWVLLVSFLFAINESRATNYYINDNTTTNDVYCSTVGNAANDGLSTSTPVPSITAILNLYGPAGNNTIAPGDTFLIDAGTYFSVDNALGINIDNLTFIGAGSLLTLFDNGPCGSCSGEFFAYITGNNVTFQGMTLTRYQNDAGNGGKSITVDGATGVVIDDVNMISGIDNGDAALLVYSNSDVIFRNSSASCNASNYGGGIQVEGSNITMLIENCVVADNAKNNSYIGGGIQIGGVSNVTVDIVDSKIVNNVAGIGAGIWVESADLNIYNTCIEGNALNQSSGYGGGIGVGYNANVYIEECSFLNNTANPLSADGGAIGFFAQNSLVTLQQCYFEGNTAAGSGDAIYIDRAFSAGTAVLNANESIFATSPAQSLYRKSDATLSITNSGIPQTDSGSSAITGNSNAQTLGQPTTNCPTNSNPCLLIALPVELIRFEGYCQDSGVKLEWETATEHNNDYFIFERAGDDWVFEQIGRVNGAGNSNELQSYFYQDRNLSSELYYYRLVQVDYDGTTTEYSTIAVEYDCGSRDISISYSSNQLYFMNLSAEIDQLSIFNSTGQLVYEMISPDLIGNRMKLDKILSRGIYIVSVVSNNKTSTSKVQINH